MNNRCEKTANTITRHPNYRFFYQKPSLNPPSDSLKSVRKDIYKDSESFLNLYSVFQDKMIEKSW